MAFKAKNPVSRPEWTTIPTSPPLTNLIGWYDPSDITTLFQDAAMTIPVTTSGQNIRAILDKSGTGNHLVHGAGTVMTYLDSGGLKSINFSNTYLTETTFTGANALSQLSVFGSWNLTTRNNTTPVFLSNAGITAIGVQVQGLTAGPVTNIYTNAVVAFAFPAVIQGSALVATAWFDGTAAAGLKGRLRVNGVNSTASAGTSAATNTPNCTLLRWPSSNTAATGGAAGNAYGLLVYSDVKTGADLAQAEQYLASKAGITI
jgi:hypothetical protein